MPLTLTGAGGVPGGGGGGSSLLTGLLAYWHCASAAEQVAGKDWEPFGESPLPTWGTAAGRGFAGFAADPPYQNAYVNDASFLNLVGTDFTVAFWVSFVDYAAYDQVVGKCDVPGAGQWYCRYVPDFLKLQFTVAGYEAGGALITPPAAGTTFQVICEYDLATEVPSIAINNGTPVDGPAYTISTSNHLVRTGFDGVATYHRGGLGEVGVWGRKLTPTEKAALQTTYYPWS